MSNSINGTETDHSSVSAASGETEMKFKSGESVFSHVINECVSIKMDGVDYPYAGVNAAEVVHSSGQDASPNPPAPSPWGGVPGIKQRYNTEIMHLVSLPPYAVPEKQVKQK